MAFYPLSPGSDYGQSPDPLTDNWTYDSAIDLFAWNPVMPDLFTLDLPEGFMNFEAKGVLGDEFAAPPDIGGYAVASLPEDVSESVSDPESDDHPWSPAHGPINNSPKPTTPTEAEPCKEQPSSPDFSQDLHSHPPASPPSPPSPSRPRRRSSDAPVRNAAKRAAHNVIEKRYRTNMNAKFVALEKAMNNGSCSSIEKPSKGGASASLKKSEILTNAVAYMHELQEENRYLRKEVAFVKGFGTTPAATGVGNGIWKHQVKREGFL